MQHYSLCPFIGLLVVAFQSDAFADLPTECCFTYYGRKIPINKIDSYIDTIGCTKPGIVFTTKKGYRVCVDPQLSWVRGARKAFDDYSLQDRCFSCGPNTKGIKMSPDPIPTGHSTTRLRWFHSVSDSQRQSDLTSLKSDGNTNDYGSTDSDQLYGRSGLYNGRTRPLTTNQQLKESAISSHLNTVSVNEASDRQTLTVFCLGNQFGQQR